MIKTVYKDQRELLSQILTLHCKGKLDADLTYSKGAMHDHRTRPTYKYDLNPLDQDTIKMDSTEIHLAPESFDSVLFDPPFLFGGGSTGVMNERFGSFKTSAELFKMYFLSMSNIHRVLKRNGVLIFKCQDLVNGGTQTFTHCEIYNMARTIGFYALDLFILVTKNKIKSPNTKKQLHARKNHCYFWVLKKCRMKNKAYYDS